VTGTTCAWVRCAVPIGVAEAMKMSGNSKHHGPDDLSVPEKILRVQDLWDDIARSPRKVELTPAQGEEAERRLREHEIDPRPCPSWDEIKHRLEGEP
jgi:putative addiction module component (TIGR02574 family)